MVKRARTFEPAVPQIFLHGCGAVSVSPPSATATGMLWRAPEWLQSEVFILPGVWAVGNTQRCSGTQWAVGLSHLSWDSRDPRIKTPIFLRIENASLSSSVSYCGWAREALLVPSYHIAIPFIFFVITAGNFVRLEETFTSIKPPNLHQASDRLGPNGSRFTSFQAPSIRLTVTADGPVILSIFHTQTSGLLTALCTLGNCFCCELNFN